MERIAIKNLEKKEKPGKKLSREGKFRLKNKTSKHKLMDLESSSEEGKEWVESGDSLIDIDIFKNDQEDNFVEYERPLEISNGNYVLVAFIGGKRNTVTFKYVSVVQKVFDKNDIEVMAMRSLAGKKDTFIMKESDISVVKERDIIVESIAHLNVLLSDCACLCLEHPKEVLWQLLLAAVTTEKRSTLMVVVLNHLRCVCDLPLAEFEENLITHLVRQVMGQETWTNQAETSFVQLVTSLVNHNILNGGVFVQTCLLPAIDDSVRDKNWTPLLRWLNTLQPFLDGSVKFNCGVDNACLLVLLAQVLERSHLSIHNFSQHVVLVREQTSALVDLVISEIVKENKLPENTCKWLESRLANISSANRRYFYKLWVHLGSVQPTVKDVGFLLLHLAHCGSHCALCQQAAHTFNDADDKRTLIVYTLIEVLPICTPKEWEMLATALTTLDSSPGALFSLVSDALLLIVAATRAELLGKHEGSLMPWLEYLVRNMGLTLGIFLKNSVNLNLKTFARRPLLLSRQVFHCSHDSNNAVCDPPTQEYILPDLKNQLCDRALETVKRALHILKELPQPAQESCGPLMMNILVELIMCVPSPSEETVRDMGLSVAALHRGEMQQVLARKLLEVWERAVALES
ncbi:unnamed protein product [Timema podura]|uniref:Uncharacterized protein n=1 Tax=Timema podura TaxID=61482 RepID=A0ABN7NVG1_TIMPD|nr:unnamed protein product [Timema podura]